jgi:hypothetical protein
LPAALLVLARGAIMAVATLHVRLRAHIMRLPSSRNANVEASAAPSAPPAAPAGAPLLAAQILLSVGIRGLHTVLRS